MGYLVNKKAVVIFDKSNGDYIEGKIVGKLDGDEEYLVRPNKWLTDLVVFKATFKKKARQLLIRNSYFVDL
ncbi:MAG: hypothetical protein RXQ99_01830 [Acidianus sp.]|uniref:hypothetical protein n=1 Tax=Acidianus sp. TaxID=1872104 RepID=UPI00397ACC0B